MKNFYFIFLLLLSYSGLHGQSYMYHRLKFVGTTSEEASSFCGQSATWDVYVNIRLSQPLEQGQIYYIQNMTAGNSGDGYYKVNYALDSEVSSAPNINGNNVGSPLCSNPKSLKYHRIIFAQSTTQAEATEELCNATSWNSKKNILTEEPLQVGKIYFSNASTYEGHGYFKVITASNNPGSDADGNYINSTQIDGPLTSTDSDNDGIPNICDNCPNKSNPNQADRDGDGKGDVCDDSDGDGVMDAYDDCPTEPGPSSNDGCPEGEADLVLDKSGTIISSECSSCPGPLSNLGSQRHIISRNAGILSFNLIIVDNQGSASAGSSKIGLYLSSDNKLDSNDFKFSTTFSLSSINAGSSKDSSGSIFGSDFDYNQAFGNYYLLLVLDVNKSIDESNEDNNVTAIPIRYRENF